MENLVCSSRRNAANCVAPHNVVHVELEYVLVLPTVVLPTVILREACVPFLGCFLGQAGANQTATEVACLAGSNRIEIAVTTCKYRHLCMCVYACMCVS